MTRYVFSLPWGEELTLDMDLAQASASICSVDDDGETHCTPYQTADARHSYWRALRLVLHYFGSDYYADPSDDRDDEDILDEVIDATSLEDSP